MEIVFRLFVCFGIVTVVTESDLLYDVKTYLAGTTWFSWLSILLNCSLCFGFWVGLVMSFIESPLCVSKYSWLTYLYDGFLVSAGSFLFVGISTKLIGD